MNSREDYMRRCLQLAANGLGTTYPNPLVGSVIVDENEKIIGEGWHYQSGMPHAEVNAIQDAESKGYTTADFNKSTIYVNLEPCSHTGKTPPCASLIIEKGFQKVVVGTLDPHHKVAGKGCQMLTDAGIDVQTSVLEAECSFLNRRFFTFHQLQRPFIILKWAETADGFIAPRSKNKLKPVWITNKYSRQRAHQLRAEEQAILVGAQTVLQDDPELTARDWHGHQPTRIVLDSKNTLDVKHRIFNDAAPTLRLPYHTHQVAEITAALYKNNIQSVIIEGGTTTLQQFIDADLWDQAYQFMGTTVYFKDGISAPKLGAKSTLQRREIIQDDVLKIYTRI
jgi:diaminohydroxyphosphoribosylaminopyrimidine deaminase/5-amino-6-(5-phosphoribosylamino)uracil reductase